MLHLLPSPIIVLTAKILKEENLDASLASLAVTCQVIHETVTPVLWKRIDLSSFEDNLKFENVEGEILGRPHHLSISTPRRGADEHLWSDIRQSDYDRRNPRKGIPFDWPRLTAFSNLATLDVFVTEVTNHLPLLPSPSVVFSSVTTLSLRDHLDPTFQINRPQPDLASIDLSKTFPRVREFSLEGTSRTIGQYMAQLYHRDSDGALAKGFGPLRKVQLTVHCYSHHGGPALPDHLLTYLCGGVEEVTIEVRHMDRSHKWDRFAPSKMPRFRDLPRLQKLSIHYLDPELVHHPEDKVRIFVEDLRATRGFGAFTPVETYFVGLARGNARDVLEAYMEHFKDLQVIDIDWPVITSDGKQELCEFKLSKDAETGELDWKASGTGEAAGCDDDDGDDDEGWEDESEEDEQTEVGSDFGSEE